MEHIADLRVYAVTHDKFLQCQDDNSTRPQYYR